MNFMANLSCRLSTNVRFVPKTAQVTILASSRNFASNDHFKLHIVLGDRATVIISFGKPDTYDSVSPIEVSTVVELLGVSLQTTATEPPNQPASSIAIRAMHRALIELQNSFGYDAHDNDTAPSLRMDEMSKDRLLIAIDGAVLAVINQLRDTVESLYGVIK